VEFYREILPSRIIWEKISNILPNVKSNKGFLIMLMNWIFVVVLVYTILSGTGSLIFGNIISTLICIIFAAVLITIIYRNLKRNGWAELIN
jgi:hypothetical protein